MPQPVRTDDLCVTTRTYSQVDRDAVVALWRACGLVVAWNDPERDIARKTAFQPGLFLVATAHERVIGTVMAGYDGRRGWINYLAVAPDLRRCGIGRTLIAEAESRLRAFGCAKINLNVRHSNEAVVAFYERVGYSTDAVVCMGKRLIEDSANCDECHQPEIPVRIRPYVMADAPALCEAATESVDAVGKWLPWCHSGYCVQDSRDWIAHGVLAREKGDEHNFAIFDGQDRFVGGCGLNSLSHAHRTANLGYWVRASRMGEGIAPAAVRLLVDYAWRETDLERLEIVAAIGNHRSRRVAEKSGAIPEGISHARLRVNGDMHDAAVYAFVRAPGRPE